MLDFGFGAATAAFLLLALFILFQLPTLLSAPAPVTVQVQTGSTTGPSTGP